MGPLVEGERVVITVMAQRIVTDSQNFSIVSNGTRHFLYHMYRMNYMYHIQYNIRFDLHRH